MSRAPWTPETRIKHAMGLSARDRLPTRVGDVLHRTPERGHHSGSRADARAPHPGFHRVYNIKARQLRGENRRGKGGLFMELSGSRERRDGQPMWPERCDNSRPGAHAMQEIAAAEQRRRDESPNGQMN